MYDDADFSAMAKLGHPDGEINLTKGAGNTGIIQGVSMLSISSSSTHSRSRPTPRVP